MKVYMQVQNADEWDDLNQCIADKKNVLSFPGPFFSSRNNFWGNRCWNKFTEAEKQKLRQFGEALAGIECVHDIFLGACSSYVTNQLM